MISKGFFVFERDFVFCIGFPWHFSYLRRISIEFVHFESFGRALESLARGLWEACDWEPLGVCGSLSGGSGSLWEASGSVWERLSQASHKPLPRLSQGSEDFHLTSLSQAFHMPLTSISQGSHKAIAMNSYSRKRNMMHMISKRFLLFERGFFFRINRSSRDFSDLK